ncbi:hypothetical protein [Ruegeria halocynthiae]|uniref:hypothetical protein n=1 Tax=Ruegeria halocynthiae TaxID=985054 RepID=UPI00056BB67B|nr:hypothetical protein [Ruegeria halocynthiae]
MPEFGTAKPGAGDEDTSHVLLEMIQERAGQETQPLSVNVETKYSVGQNLANLLFRSHLERTLWGNLWGFLNEHCLEDIFDGHRRFFLQDKVLARQFVLRVLHLPCSKAFKIVANHRVASFPGNQDWIQNFAWEIGNECPH